MQLTSTGIWTTIVSGIIVLVFMLHPPHQLAYCVFRKETIGEHQINMTEDSSWHFGRLLKTCPSLCNIAYIMLNNTFSISSTGK